MIKPTAFVVSVDYWDYLETTLPRMAELYEHVHVITTPEDRHSALVASAISFASGNVSVFSTDAFYADNAYFNKGLAIETCLERVDPQGWVAVQDADILLPPKCNWEAYDMIPGCIYSPARRNVTPGQFPEDREWAGWPLASDNVTYCPGFLQVFHSTDRRMTKRPWYPTHWRHAGGSDSDFCEKWPKRKQKRLPFEVLHMGPTMRNWCGRVSDYTEHRGRPGKSKEHAERMADMLNRRHRGSLKFEKLTKKRT